MLNTYNRLLNRYNRLDNSLVLREIEIQKQFSKKRCKMYILKKDTSKQKYK